MNHDTERLRRWRLILGNNEGDASSAAVELTGGDVAIDQALEALYGGQGKGRPNRRAGGLGASAPNVARWLGDIRKYFPASVVRVMQQDAIERLDLRRMLLEPELLESLEPDVNLVADLIALGAAMPGTTRETARSVVRKVVEDLEKRLANPMRQAVQGALNRGQRNRRPRGNEMDWRRTILANLKHYQPAYGTIVPEKKIGFGRKRAAQRDVILCVDQSGSMATSVVYAGIFAAVLASLPAVSTKLVVFDTAVVDLTQQLADPVEVLFSTQLGGGTDIARALQYCQTLIRRPEETILVLVSDLVEGGNREELIKRVGEIVRTGAQVVALLALGDEGAPAYDHANAAALARLGAPAFACTPDLFPELMAAAMDRRDVGGWAASRGIVTSRGDENGST